MPDLVIILICVLMVGTPLGFIWLTDSVNNPVYLIPALISFVVLLVVASIMFETNTELDVYRDLGSQGWVVYNVTAKSGREADARIVTDKGWLDCRLSTEDGTFVIKDVDDCNKVKPVKRDKIATPEDFNS